MNPVKQRKYCKPCLSHHTRGIKDGKHNNWCCKYSKPAIKAIGECVNKDGRTLTNSEAG